MKDHCDPNPCKMGGHCISGHTSFTCRCPSGYTGRVCSECKYDVSYSLKSFFLLYQLPSMFFPTSTHLFFRTQLKAIPALFSLPHFPHLLTFSSFLLFPPQTTFLHLLSNLITSRPGAPLSWPLCLFPVLPKLVISWNICFLVY